MKYSLQSLQKVLKSAKNNCNMNFNITLMSKLGDASFSYSFSIKSPSVWRGKKACLKTEPNLPPRLMGNVRRVLLVVVFDTNGKQKIKKS